MELDEASAQLHAELRQSIARALDPTRPLLHHINADSSWLLQLPRPRDEYQQVGRHYFNIIIDPWLAGGQSDVAAWFSTQWHASESKYATIAAVEELIRDVEVSLAESQAPAQGSRRNVDVGVDTDTGDGKSLIDAVVISHEFTDHCHKATLLEIDPSIPVFATEVAADLVSSWSHFNTVQKTPKFGGETLDWRSTSLSPLPSWVSISRLVTAGDALYYHSAVLITFELEGSRTAESIIYSPHGIQPTDLEVLPRAKPAIETLCFLHGLHDISIASQKQLNLGAHNGLKAQRILKAKYWVGTHDEVKKGGGLISWLLRRKAYSLSDALHDESKKAPEHDDVAKDPGRLANANWLELGNGDSRVLI